MNEGPGRDAMIQIGKKLVERMSWKSQSQTIRFAFLERLLSVPTQIVDNNTIQWVLRIISSPQGIIDRKLFIKQR